MSEWISVKDSLPAVYDRVLCLFNDEQTVLALIEVSPTPKEDFNAFSYWREPLNECMDIAWHDVTHWMPLPAPPTK